MVLCTDYYYIYFIVRMGNKFKSDVEFLGFNWGTEGVIRNNRYVVNYSNCEVALLLFSTFNRATQFSVYFFAFPGRTQFLLSIIVIAGRS